MIKETWWSGVDKTKTPEEINPKGGTYRDDNDVFHFVRFKDMNNQEKFEKELENKAVAKWAYQHGLGLYGNQANLMNDNGYDIEARAAYLGKEAFYDEDNFFWVKLEEYEKPLLCQLRVANHEVSYAQYELTHSQNPKVQCDTCLNIQIGNQTRDTFNKQATGNNKITVINAILDTDNISEEQMEKIETLVGKITHGAQPVVTLDELNEMFGGQVTVSSSGGQNVRDNQFTPRQNIVRERPHVVNWNVRQDGYPEMIPFSAVDVKSPFEFKGKQYFTTNYEGNTYAFDEKECVAYPIKKNGYLSLANPIVVESIKRKTIIISERQRKRLFNIV